MCSDSPVYIAGRATDKPLPAAREARSASICWRKEPCRGPGSLAQKEGCILVDTGNQQHSLSYHCSTVLHFAPSLAVAIVLWCDVSAKAQELQHALAQLTNIWVSIEAIALSASVALTWH